MERTRGDDANMDGDNEDGQESTDIRVGSGEDGEADIKHGSKGDRGGKKKRHRAHRKKPWGLALRDMDLRVMTKYVIYKNNILFHIQ